MTGMAATGIAERTGAPVFKLIVLLRFRSGLPINGSPLTSREICHGEGGRSLFQFLGRMKRVARSLRILGVARHS